MDKNEARKKQRKHKKFKEKKTEGGENVQDDEIENSFKVTSKTLLNNWARYEIADTENEVPKGADFEMLLGEPTSDESYFKFKSEQNLDNDLKSHIQLSKYFTLDLKLLNEGISCIPFFQRHSYEPSLFSATDVGNMKKTAEVNTQKYKNYVEKRFSNKKEKIVIVKENEKNINSSFSSVASEHKITNKQDVERKIGYEETYEMFGTVAKLNSAELTAIDEARKLPTVEIKNQTDDNKKPVAENIKVIDNTEEIKPVINLEEKQQEEKVPKAEDDSSVTKTAAKAIVAHEILPPRKRESKKTDESSKLNESLSKSSEDRKLEDEVDDLLNLKHSAEEEPDIIAEDPLLEPTPDKNSVTSPKTAMDLEQWLDDILDD